MHAHHQNPCPMYRKSLDPGEVVTPVSGRQLLRTGRAVLDGQQGCSQSTSKKRLSLKEPFATCATSPRSASPISSQTWCHESFCTRHCHFHTCCTQCHHCFLSGNRGHGPQHRFHRKKCTGQGRDLSRLHLNHNYKFTDGLKELPTHQQNAKRCQTLPCASYCSVSSNSFLWQISCLFLWPLILVFPVTLNAPVYSRVCLLKFSPLDKYFYCTI